MLNFTGINTDLKQQDLQTTIKKGTHLVIHSYDLRMDRPFFNYCHKLHNEHNLDGIVAISSKPDNTFHPGINTYWPDMVTLGDTKQEWAGKLKQLWKLERTPEELIKLLSYQMLFKDGELIYSKHQPVKDHYQELLQNKDAMRRMINDDLEGSQWGDNGKGSARGKHHAKIFKNLRQQDEGSLWELPIWFGEQSKGPEGHGPGNGFINFLFYYHLWPNKELEEHLIKLSHTA